MKNKNIFVVLIIVLLLVFFAGFGFMNLFRGSYTGYFGFNLLFGIIAIICAVLVIYDVLVNNKGLSDGMKILWVILALIFSIVTAIIYYLIGRNGRNDLFVKNSKNDIFRKK